MAAHGGAGEAGSGGQDARSVVWRGGGCLPHTGRRILPGAVRAPQDLAPARGRAVATLADDSGVGARRGLVWWRTEEVTTGRRRMRRRVRECMAAV